LRFNTHTFCVITGIDSTVARMQMDPSGRHHPTSESPRSLVDTRLYQPQPRFSALKEQVSDLTMLWDRFFQFRTAIPNVTDLYVQFLGRFSAHGITNAVTCEPFLMSVPVGNTWSLNCMLPTVRRWDHTDWPFAYDSGSWITNSISSSVGVVAICGVVAIFGPNWRP